MSREEGRERETEIAGAFSFLNQNPNIGGFSTAAVTRKLLC